MIFIFWSFHGYYIRKEKNLCFSGVCQPNQKLFIDLPVWGNSNLIFSQCLWCISSYGCWLLWALCSYNSDNIILGNIVLTVFFCLHQGCLALEFLDLFFICTSPSVLWNLSFPFNFVNNIKHSQLSDYKASVWLSKPRLHCRLQASRIQLRASVSESVLLVRPVV